MLRHRVAWLASLPITLAALSPVSRDSQATGEWMAASCGSSQQYIDGKGVIRLTIEAQWIGHFSEGLAAISRGDRWGFINEAGAVVVPLRFTEVGPFSHGIARACSGIGDKKRCGFIDHSGANAIPFSYTDAWTSREGIAFGRREDGIDALSPSGGIVAALPSSCNPDRFGEGFLPCQVEDRVIIRDLSGYTIPGPPLLTAGGFHNGLSAVKLLGQKTWTYLDKTGKVLPLSDIAIAEDFSEGLAAVMTTAGLWGYIDLSGKLVIAPQFRYARPFHLDRAVVVGARRNGFIDRTGRMVIPDVFLEVYSGFEGLGLARVLMPPGYGGKVREGAKRLHPGSISTRFPNGFIDRRGNVVWRCAPTNPSPLKRELGQ